MTTYQGYPFIPAAHYAAGRSSAPRIVVVHTAETGQTSTTAAAVARFFAGQPKDDPNPTSAHAMADAGQLIRMVRDTDTAYAAGTHANRLGLHIEHAGKAAYHLVDWSTPYSKSMLALSAHQVAAWCHAYRIPVVRLTPADLRAGRPGICGHYDVHQAWPADTSHTDPGAAWPWASYLAAILDVLHPPVPPDHPHQEEPMVTLYQHTIPGHVPAMFAVAIDPGAPTLPVVEWVQKGEDRNALVAAGAVMATPVPPLPAALAPYISGTLPPLTP